jgi:ribosomal protein L37AE/L43A
MDMPCPKCNSTDLKKVSPAYEEGLYQSGKCGQFRSVLVGSGDPGVLVGTSTTKGTNKRGLTAQSSGVGTCRICKSTSAGLLSFETFVVQIPVAMTASRSLLVARHQNHVAGRTLRAES